ncbi:MAG: HAD family hydrolase [Desulfobacteraceae bacterium]|nr:MAG: HAD family hydrolase [Desulfobacteraceae bacterium]
MNLIMFDLDGTLIKSSSLDTRCLLGAIEMSMGILNAESDWTKYRYVTDAGIASEIVKRHLGRKATEEDLVLIRSRMAELLEAEARINRDKFAPVPGALDLIHTLKVASGCGFAIATGCWSESALFKLSTAGFDVAGLPMASSDDSYDRGEIMAAACERAKIFYAVDGFKTITYVGDGLWDLESSQRMGYRFIGISSGDNGAAFRQKGASCVLEDFSDKAAFLAAMDEIWLQGR